MKLDNIHYTSEKIDSYNLAFNFVISAREAGKSTFFCLRKAYRYFKEFGYTTLYIRRKIVHLTNAYISDLNKIINKFTDDAVIFKYSKASMKDGIVDVYIDDKLFIRIIGLSADITAIKSLVLPNIKFIIFDEFICNPRFGEKYLTDEVHKFFKVYATFNRECDGVLKCYFLGNPYSLYNPYFVYFKVPIKQLKKGALITDKKRYVVECYDLKPELLEHILAKNPLYLEEDEYTQYAFNGEAINDKNIWICDKAPSNFTLYTLFKTGNKYLAVFSNNNALEFLYEMRFYIQEVNFEVSKHRNIYCFELDDLVNGTIVANNNDIGKFRTIKRAMQLRLIAFKDINCYYLFEEIYYYL